MTGNDTDVMNRQLGSSRDCGVKSTISVPRADNIAYTRTHTEDMPAATKHQFHRVSGEDSSGDKRVLPRAWPVSGEACESGVWTRATRHGTKVEMENKLP
jgi:hypothetical protein